MLDCTILFLTSQNVLNSAYTMHGTQLIFRRERDTAFFCSIGDFFSCVVIFKQPSAVGRRLKRIPTVKVKTRVHSYFANRPHIHLQTDPT
jgi:hypothetical protein